MAEYDQALLREQELSQEHDDRQAHFHDPELLSETVATAIHGYEEFATFIMLAHRHPDLYRARTVAFFRAQLTATRFYTPAILAAVFCGDFRELEPEIGQIATVSGTDADSPDFYTCGKMRTLAGTHCQLAWLIVQYWRKPAPHRQTEIDTRLGWCGDIKILRDLTGF